MTRPHGGAIELWGGVECTVVRIGDEVRCQLSETGHRDRMADLDAIAELGIRTVRYPIVWETVAPDSPSERDFSWHDRRLERLRELGIEVVAGLVHHGSGPKYTSLIDPGFPELLADYAGAVARRYPWVRQWTPVNEPLTTARFSCLYGHWYPHLGDTGAMLRAVAIQCDATLQAMRAIRAEIADAQLLATEDLGKTFATRPLAEQAAYENERRWLSLDLLDGRVTGDHPFHRALLEAGVEPERLERLESGEARPDIIGINHYLTSERFLDHRLDRYPAEEPGGNGRDRYVDVDAARVPRIAHLVGPARRLREAWQRYRLPLVVSEVHHGCTRDEQLRWLIEVWDAAQRERHRGADIRAVTLWSMFGAVDWRSLLTRRDGHYDVGVFDSRGRAPRPTAIAMAARKLAVGKSVDHPVLDLPGWWKRPGRSAARPSFDRMPRRTNGARPILITGKTGTLGQAFARICAHRGLPHVLTGRDELDLFDEASIAAAIERVRPWAVINAAGFVRTWEADRLADECRAANALGPERLARACRNAGIKLVTFSSDLVFDGLLGRPYREGDPVRPACTYGLSKAEGERRIAALGHDDVLVIRTSAFFGPWDRHNFAFRVIEQLRRGEPVRAPSKAIVSPTYVPDLVHATLDLLIDDERGVWHLANQGSASWNDLARDVAARTGMAREPIGDDKAARPADTSLASDHGFMLRPLDAALDDFVYHSEPLRALL